jgi:outer membrane protein assembly factor BamB
MHLKYLFAIAASLTMFATYDAAADWPMYRADAARSGYTAEAIPNQLQLRWSFRASQAPRPAWVTSERMKFDVAFQPIIMGDRVLFSSSVDDQLYCLNAVTGAVEWTFYTEGPIRFAPVGWQERVFLASDDGYLYALRLSDGELLWKKRGGPSDDRVLGNDRMTSHWPARGGPVVLDDTVYFAAGIWPSDGIYLHAIDAATGDAKWTNGETGGLYMAQPHGGANAKSGVAPQGYLLASDKQLFAPTGRAVPAAFDRNSGELTYYHLQKNQQRGGAWAMLADKYLLNSGCLFDQASGELIGKQGFGPTVATPEGLLWASGRSLVRYRWKDVERRDRKGKNVTVRALEQTQSIQRDREVFELIVAGNEAICGEEGRISTVDFTRQRTTWWTHDVEGTVFGLAAAGGRIIASTDRGVIYCFDGEPGSTVAAKIADDKTVSEDQAVAIAAEEILQKTGATDGYCVDLGAGDGRLALELAKRTNLQIYAVEADVKKVAVARKLLSDAGLYGSRVTVHHADPAKVAYPKYFANLIVSSQSLNQKFDEATSENAFRMQRPYGGKICTGSLGEMQVDTRGELAGAGSWTHHNADAANTICSKDQVVRGPLRVSWFRDVDFEIPNRHGQGPAPLSHRGHLVVGGVDGLISLDAYNGRTEWKFAFAGHLRDYDGIHHDVGVSETGGTYCLSDDSVYVRSGERCIRVDLATGKKVREFSTPVSANAKDRDWGYLAFHDGLLFGSVSNEQHTVSPRYKLTRLRNESVSLFAIDPDTGDVRWQFKPKHSIRNNAIAITGDRVYLIDRELAEADHISNPKRDGRHRPLLKPGDQADGELIALDVRSGKEVWRKTDDIFGTQLAVSNTHEVLLMFYQAVRHNFFKLPSEVGGRIAAFDTADGKRRWDNTGDYKTRPLINDYRVYSQGGSWDLLTGETLPFKFDRSYGCGQIAASANLMLFRSGTLGYVDLTRDAGTENIGGVRPGCWINAIPAGGLVLIPDGSSKCKCSYQMRAWFALHGED